MYAQATQDGAILNIKNTRSFFNYFKDIKFDRNEWSEPLVTSDRFPPYRGHDPHAGLDSASVLVMFGIMQIFTGSLYKMPCRSSP
ncbi:MAG: hypothetical protein Ct9H300mP2_4000 [Candidatus Neomarinimicrobiota bacterium]|nr:MAG: hypothetical protein Ct9H300mP2_4000 [Candidatus Neomarinimicrobiota bacterium]